MSEINPRWAGGRAEYGYADMRHMPLFLINKDVPPDNVKYGYTEATEQLVKNQRNSKGVVVSKVVGKRLLKFDNLEWPYMIASDYNWLQRQIAKFHAYVTYYDAREGGIITKKFYWGDFSAEPFKFTRDSRNGLLVPSVYINVKVNLIDCGEGPISGYLSASEIRHITGND